ncbi:acylphosphatase [Roseovarius ramblicola]|uniref:Acylphosphatase n=1 Tax=Roseovarius ramblicola TaxID=2022336 RepID=A0ABV5I0B2_9RHOB
MSGIKAVGVRVRGRVQGVSFRAWTQVEAQGRGLSGWVRNEPDGAVRAHIEGPAPEVDAMLAALHTGPPAAVVREVTVHDAAPEDAARFEIKR